MFEALNAGHKVLNSGGSSIDAVIQAIKVMEDNPLFNAGKGSVLTNEGTIEMEASIMEGKALNAGAISGLRLIKNPIEAAYKVITHSDHVMLSGDNAENFAV